ncbi:hypothetical protein K0M31_017795 [Melipona bicolor]|uniref:Uncharacterized protein n=1 Tax=Melipona bicolor TaxID=60889 RepID=A0AA40KSS1_9HYME|nr:hypothetical protein K0M31_017795 [Melipona bicolor]
MSGSDSPTFFHGQPWSSWIERIGRDKPLSKCAESSSKMFARSLPLVQNRDNGERLAHVPNLNFDAPLSVDLTQGIIRARIDTHLFKPVVNNCPAVITADIFVE